MPPGSGSTGGSTGHSKMQMPASQRVPKPESVQSASVEQVWTLHQPPQSSPVTGSVHCQQSVPVGSLGSDATGTQGSTHSQRPAESLQTSARAGDSSSVVQ